MGVQTRFGKWCVVVGASILALAVAPPPGSQADDGGRSEGPQVHNPRLQLPGVDVPMSEAAFVRAAIKVAGLSEADARAAYRDPSALVEVPVRVVESDAASPSSDVTAKSVASGGRGRLHADDQADLREHPQLGSVLVQG